MRATPEPYDEMGHLRRRGVTQYSIVHQRMYTGPAELLADGRSEILEVGFGIGFGLEVLTRKNCFRRYVGVEIDGACYDYVRSLPVGQRPDVTLLCGDFRELALDDQFDYAFCIEVIEHIEPADCCAVLRKIRSLIRKTLFLSTPDINRAEHGLFTADEITGFLYEAGFSHVVALRDQWTDLYIAAR